MRAQRPNSMALDIEQRIIGQFSESRMTSEDSQLVQEMEIGFSWIIDGAMQSNRSTILNGTELMPKFLINDLTGFEDELAFDQQPKTERSKGVMD